MSLLDQVTQQLGPGGIRQIASQIGADEQQTSTAVQTALPVLLGGLAREARTPEGAQSLGAALDRDHDGGLLDNLGGLLGAGGAGGGLGAMLGGAAGAGILGHILGGRRGAVEQGIGRASGLDAGQVGKLLMVLAPIVMAALGRMKREKGLDSGALGGVLAGEKAQLEQKNPQLGGLASILDSDGDGSIVDDLARMAGGGRAGGAGGGLGGILGGMLGGR